MAATGDCDCATLLYNLSLILLFALTLLQHAEAQAPIVMAEACVIMHTSFIWDRPATQ